MASSAPLRRAARRPPLVTARRAAAERGIPLYAVGGCVRDLLLGREVHDWDLAVPRDASILARILAGRLGGTFVPLDRNRDIARVVLREGEVVDFVRFAGGTLEDDLRRRDFTVNAMAWDPRADRLVDPTGGREDLERGRLRPTGPAVFREDPVRLLRAIRLLAQLALRPAPGLARALTRDAPLLDRAAPERIRDEWFQILEVGVSPHLELLTRTGLLFGVLPELRECRGVEQNHFHLYDVFRHTCEVVHGLEALEGADYEAVGVCRRELLEHLARPLAGHRSRRSLLKLAAFLHDVAKPATWQRDPRGRIRFLGHDRLGGPVAARAGRRLALAIREVRYLEQVVRLHLRPVLLPRQDPGPRALHRFFRAAGEQAPDLLLLSWADVEASRGPASTPEVLEEHHRWARDMLEEYFLCGRVAHPPRLVTGRDLMEGLGLPEGPGIGQLLRRLDEAVASGEVRTREEALQWAAERAGSEGEEGRPRAAE